MPRAGKLFLILAVWIFGSGWVSGAWAENQILNIRHWVAPDHTRIVIDMTEDAPFTVEKGEQTLAVDIESTSMPSQLPAAIILKKPGVDQILLSSPTPVGVRVELILPGPVQSTVFKLKKFEDKPYRIVVDLVLPDTAKKESEARERIKITRKARIVVIDPGHGGDAPGAVGKQGTLEKDVVLAISKKLRDLLNAKEGYRAFLTRDGDYYVSFNKRLMIAREYGADLFVSIHADAARNREASGSSVYCLSNGGASSEAAKILARSENLADVVGGVPNGEGSDASDPIILDMFQTHAINQSRNFGGVLLGDLGAANRLKFATVQEAPFRVLKLPEIPSILVETAYISNPKEEKLLRTDRFQARIAEAVSRSIVQFLPPLPPADPIVFAGKREEAAKSKNVTPAEGKGRAKPKIAEKSPQAPVASKEVTETKPHDAVAGEVKGPGKLKLKGKRAPAPMVSAGKEEAELKQRDAAAADGKGPAKRAVAVKRPPPAPAPKPEKSYRVKKGDTLAAIAAKHGTTTQVLMELNRLKRPNLLYVDRKLILPGS